MSGLERTWRYVYFKYPLKHGIFLKLWPNGFQTLISSFPWLNRWLYTSQVRKVITCPSGPFHFKTEINISLQIPVSCLSVWIQSSMKDKLHFSPMILFQGLEESFSSVPYSPFFSRWTALILSRSANFHQVPNKCQALGCVLGEQECTQWHSPCSWRGVCISVAKTNIKDWES